jgi:very-short-patch-repair endonuclease
MDVNYLDIDIVKQHFAAASLVVAREASGFFEEVVGSDLQDPAGWRLDLESPAEAIFFLWFKALTQTRLTQYVLQHQRKVDIDGTSYRIDFVIQLRGSGRSVSEMPEWQHVAIEIDGHAFHEKTREQVSHRNIRDRRLQRAGWVVFHFSYAELTTQPEQCVSEVLSFVHGQWIELFGRLATE